MPRKEQNKILNDKIEANNAQYNLHRMNAEISAYSSGDLPKYEYLTKKDLKYKPDAFEQAKFEYSPLGKVFTDGLDKSDRNESLLKRLKNIEDRKNNQDKKIVYKNVDTKVDTKKFNIYNIFQKYLNKDIDYDRIDMIERSIKNGIKIYQERPHTDKNERIINNSNKIINAIELFKSMIDNNEFVIPG